MADKGIPCRTDDSERNHMHNKFVVVDNSFVITGSFNWTVQAGGANQENLLVVDHPYYVQAYKEEFEKLWKEFSVNCVDASKKQSAGRDRKRRDK